ncbi:type II secretion system protein [bacterium]|nr:type II secretion system protein [bacterium]
MSKMKNKAFTLAETLIVMGIIGVVAALTLPNLNSSTGDKEKVTHLMKIYTNLNDVIGRAQAVYGPVGEWFINDSSDTDRIKRMGNRLTEFLKVTKNCENASNHTSCTGSTLGNSYYSFILADGASVRINGDTAGSRMFFGIYLGGPTKNYNWPNDPFLFNLDLNTGILEPAGQNYQNCFSYGNNGNCTAWVINNGNFDAKYNSGGRCSNSSIILDGVTNTSCK